MEDPCGRPYTKGCTGVPVGPALSRQPHSEDCRFRVAALMEKDCWFQNATKRGMWNSTMRTTVSEEAGIVQRDERGPEPERELEEVRKREGEDGELGSESTHHVRRRAQTGEIAQPRGNPETSCSSALLRRRRCVLTTLRWHRCMTRLRRLRPLSFGRTSLAWRQGADFEACKPGERGENRERSGAR